MCGDNRRRDGQKISASRIVIERVLASVDGASRCFVVAKAALLQVDAACNSSCLSAGSALPRYLRYRRPACHAPGSGRVQSRQAEAAPVEFFFRTGGHSPRSIKRHLPVRAPESRFQPRSNLQLGNTPNCLHGSFSRSCSALVPPQLSK